MDTAKSNPPLTRTEGTYEPSLPVFTYRALADGERASELENLIGLDLETGGLDEQGDQILEVHARSGTMIRGRFVASCAHYPETGAVGGRYTFTLPLASNIFDWHPAVVEMHSKNGLLTEAHKATADLKKKWGEERLAAAVMDMFTEVDDALAAMFPKLPGKRSWTLLGNTVHFDQRFIRRVFPKFAAGLSHRVFDVSTVRMFCEALGLPYAKGEPAHRATEDVDVSIKCLHEYVDFCQAVPEIQNVDGTALGSGGFMVQCRTGGPYSGT